MKNLIIRITCLFLMIAGVNVYAQQKQTPPQNAPAKQASPKDELMKNLNDFQPKLNDLTTKAKENAAAIPELSKEVSKLNDMVAAFKDKLDKFDITPREQQEEYASTLRSDWSAIESQYNKASDLLKTNPNNGMSKSKDDQHPPK